MSINKTEIRIVELEAVIKILLSECNSWRSVNNLPNRNIDDLIIEAKEALKPALVKTPTRRNNFV